jgi:hypothetical protein
MKKTEQFQAKNSSIPSPKPDQSWHLQQRPFTDNTPLNQKPSESVASATTTSEANQDKMAPVSFDAANIPLYAPQSEGASPQESEVIQRQPTPEEAKKEPTPQEVKTAEFKEKYKDHAHLWANIDAQAKEPEIIAKLLENFHMRNDFNYNFNRSRAFTHEGDCGTLVEEFITIARECFNITNIEESKGDRGYFIAGGGKIVHKDSKTGNVDDGRHWYFEKHVWALWNGKPIDVLFGQLDVVSHQAGVTGNYDRKEQTVVYKASNIAFYLNKGASTPFQRYTTNPDKKLKLS